MRKTKLCSFFEVGKCRNQECSEFCEYARGPKELRKGPFSKKKLCKFGNNCFYFAKNLSFPFLHENPD